MNLLYPFIDEAQEVKGLLEGHLVVNLRCLVKTGPCRSLCGLHSETPGGGNAHCLQEHLCVGRDLILIIKNECSIQ